MVGGGRKKGGARREPGPSLFFTGFMASSGFFYPGNLHVNFAAHVQSCFLQGEEWDSKSPAGALSALEERAANVVVGINK